MQTRNTNQNSGFRKLFNYISGKNSNSEKIAMTVPVTQTNNLMQFYLPIKFDYENTPIPTDDDVNISTVPGGHYAVIKYGGRTSDSNFLKHTEFLRSSLSDDGIKILSEPKNSLTKQYQELFKLEGVKLNFKDGALKEIANKAISKKTGARGLRSILESILLKTMFDLPSEENIEEVIIDNGAAKGHTQPILVHSKNSKNKTGKSSAA